MEILEHPKSDDFEGINLINLDYDDADIGLSVYIDQCPWLEVFNIKEVDYNQLLLIVNSYIIHKFCKEGLDLIPAATIFFIDNNYILEINSDTYTEAAIPIKISRETVKTIFYRILSYGAIPIDTFNGARVKMIK